MEKLISGILDNLRNSNLSVVDHAFDQNSVAALLEYFEKLTTLNQFQPAAIGTGASKMTSHEIRGDLISWIEDWNQIPALSQYKGFLDQLSSQIKREFFIPVKRAEAHFALYPPGSFYKKHTDQHRLSTHRQVSIILYLSVWQPGDGGELVAYHQPTPLKIEPLQGRLVCFMSEAVPHEVLPCHYTRKSITGWLRDDIL